MGLFSKKDPSGSKGKPGEGYKKHSAVSNPKKHEPRTEAQKAREERAFKKLKD